MAANDADNLMLIATQSGDNTLVAGNGNFDLLIAANTSGNNTLTAGGGHDDILDADGSHGYAEGRSIAEMPYPRAKSHRQVPQSVRAKLALRATLIGNSAQQIAA